MPLDLYREVRKGVDDIFIYIQNTWTPFSSRNIVEFYTGNTGSRLCMSTGTNFTRFLLSDIDCIVKAILSFSLYSSSTCLRLHLETSCNNTKVTTPLFAASSTGFSFVINASPVSLCPRCLPVRCDAATIFLLRLAFLRSFLYLDEKITWRDG